MPNKNLVLKQGINLLLFGGKGGVGKTTIATSTALEAARQGKKVLVFSTDPAHSLSDSFDCEVKHEITNITKNVDALEIDAEAELKKFREEHEDLIKKIVNEGTYLDQEDISKFSRLSWPGMDEVMALGKVIDFLDEAEYDLYILDTAPSGHTIRLLALPDLMAGWVNVLVSMHKKKEVIRRAFTGRSIEDEASRFLTKQGKRIERIRAALRDAARTQFDVITIPEAMGVYETERFIATLNRYKIPIDNVIVNRAIPVNDCGFCQGRRKEQLTYIAKLRKEFPEYNIVELPLFPSEIRGLKDLDTFSQALYKKDYRHEPRFEKALFAEHSLGKSGMHDILKKNFKLLLFGGKGGVGKTTMAAATALQAARQGKKVLVFSTDPAHSLSDSFDCEVKHEITNITKNVDALEIDAEKMFENLKEEYREEIRKFFGGMITERGGVALPLDEKIMTDLFDLSPPGVDELMALKKIIEFIDNEEYDLFILDTAPTGHTIRLLALPDQAIQWTKVVIQVRRKYLMAGDIGKTLQDTLTAIRKAKQTLTDPKKTEFIAVTIAEAMGVLQTERLVGNLELLKIPVEHLIINKIIPENKCGLCLSRRKQQQKYISKLNKKFSKYKITAQPQFPSEVKGLKTLTEFANTLFR